MNKNNENNECNIESLRSEYTRGGLRRHDLSCDPFNMFKQWLRQACDAQLPNPNAMCVATVDEKSQPYQRIVLLKYFDDKGLVFYTNLKSRKAQQLAQNPHISLLFPWHAFERQVIFLGKVEPLTTLDVLKYFYSRPKDSQIAAWASKQSSHISTRGVLDKTFLALKKKFQRGMVPFPNFWGGFLVKINSVEFWQGRVHRLHDRFLYQRNGNNWKIDRLAP